MGTFTNFRRQIGAFIGGFEGGLASRRLKGFQASRAHVNVLIQQAGSDMTARARFLIRNNGYAANAVGSWAGNVVGTGIKPSSDITDAALKDAVQKLWLRWTDEADAEGYTDFYGQQRRAARELFIAGEVFFRFRPRQKQDGLSIPLQLQMLPSEMLPLHDNRVIGAGNVIRQGIEFDRIGRRVAYHFYKRHPGDSTEVGVCGEQVRVPAESVLHVIDPVEAGQLRGFSHYARCWPSCSFWISTMTPNWIARRSQLCLPVLYAARSTTTWIGKKRIPRGCCRWNPASCRFWKTAKTSPLRSHQMWARIMRRSSIGRSCRSRRVWACRMPT